MGVYDHTFMHLLKEQRSKFMAAWLPRIHCQRQPKLLRVHSKVQLPIRAAQSESQALSSSGHTLWRQTCCEKARLMSISTAKRTRKDLAIDLIDQKYQSSTPINNKQIHCFFTPQQKQFFDWLTDSKPKFKFFDYIKQFIMNQGSFTCVNCQIHYDYEPEYKEHYKSQHHRYNVKRKLIGLAPLSVKDYYIQFQAELSSKSQSENQIYCEVCSKKFLSPQTYKHHINSQKHKKARKALLYKDKSQTSSMSEFQLIDDKKLRQLCPFCPQTCTQDHLKKAHCFPPFRQECVNFDGLLEYVSEKVKSGYCIYCQHKFESKDSVKQHMSDSGHAKLNLEEFKPFEPFYIWKISQSEEEEEKETEISQSPEKSQEFTLLQHRTLAEIEEKRQGRIKYGPTGVTINGKQVGYRAYKQYYKQYLSRQIQQAPRQTQKQLPFEQWRNARSIKSKPQFQKITAHNNHR